MPRIYYSGEGAIDNRLAGVELHHGVAVDVPEELADELLTEEAFALDEPEPLEAVEWYEPDPGEELTALDGIGPAVAAKLVDGNIITLTDMASLSDSEIVEIAEDLPRVTEDMVRGWVSEAEARRDII